MNAPKYNKRYTYWFFILYLDGGGGADDDVVVRNASRNNNIQYNRYINIYIIMLTRTCASRRAEDEPSEGGGG